MTNRSGSADDGTSGGGEGSSSYILDDAAAYGYGGSTKNRSGGGSGNNNGIPILTRLFVGCEEDAPGSVHRAWAVTVVFMVIFFTVSILEGEFAYENLTAPSLSLFLRIGREWTVFHNIIFYHARIMFWTPTL